MELVHSLNDQHRVHVQLDIFDTLILLCRHKPLGDHMVDNPVGLQENNSVYSNVLLDKALLLVHLLVSL